MKSYLVRMLGMKVSCADRRSVLSPLGINVLGALSAVDGSSLDLAEG